MKNVTKKGILMLLVLFASGIDAMSRRESELKSIAEFMANADELYKAIKNSDIATVNEYLVLNPKLSQYFDEKTLDELKDLASKNKSNYPKVWSIVTGEEVQESSQQNPRRFFHGIFTEDGEYLTD